MKIKLQEDVFPTCKKIPPRKDFLPLLCKPTKKQKKIYEKLGSKTRKNVV